MTAASLASELVAASRAVQRLLAKMSAYEPLAAEDEQLLRRAGGRVAVRPRGSDLVEQGTSPAFSCLLITGLAARYTIAKVGERQITSLHVPGDFVDLPGFLLQPLAYSVTALTACEIFYIPHGVIREITEESPSLTRALWRHTMVDASITRQWLVVKDRALADKHAAHLICEMYLLLEQVGLAANLRFELQLTQSDLSDILGISPIHMNRTIQAVRRGGSVTWRGKVITIANWDALVAMAEFDPTYLGRGPSWRPAMPEPA